ncbi:hypothetical protein [Streptomyces sp. NBC_00102]|uniref:hypothetical protein n=1 Tax=Streptomyces sp. NBC_00102 TaxID=2975652 RepID=UPI002252E8D8|nr:hypothetical protein [Streptomyces sp. NBC_00102]MCX5400077.1 hypothetical protein [Streptomyces sp. NBC_00102]
MAHATVRGLALPSRLTALVERGLWRLPGDAVPAEVVPWFADPLFMVRDPEQMTYASLSLDLHADDPDSTFFRVARGSRADTPLELPWLDAEQAVVIAVTRMPGADGALALDYRTGPTDPRVVGTDFWTDPRWCRRRVVAPAFSGFVGDLGL